MNKINEMIEEINSLGFGIELRQVISSTHETNYCSDYNLSKFPLKEGDKVVERNGVRYIIRSKTKRHGWHGQWVAELTNDAPFHSAFSKESPRRNTLEEAVAAALDKAIARTSIKEKDVTSEYIHKKTKDGER